MKKYKISAEKYFGGVPRMLHQPKNPVFSDEEMKSEVQKLYNAKYSVYTIRIAKDENLIYRSQIPNMRRGRMPGTAAKRVSVLKINQLPKERTELYYQILKKAGVSVHF